MACIEDLHLGDIGTIIRVTVQDKDSTCTSQVLNVSSATTRRFTLKKPSGAKLNVTASFTTDGTDGQIEYATVDGDLDEVGEWKIQVYLVMPGGSWRSEVGSFRVNANL